MQYTYVRTDTRIYRRSCPRISAGCRSRSWVVSWAARGYGETVGTSCSRGVACASAARTLYRLFGGAIEYVSYYYHVLKSGDRTHRYVRAQPCVLTYSCIDSYISIPPRRFQYDDIDTILKYIHINIKQPSKDQT